LRTFTPNSQSPLSIKTILPETEFIEPQPFCGLASTISALIGSDDKLGPKDAAK